MLILFLERLHPPAGPEHLDCRNPILPHYHEPLRVEGVNDMQNGDSVAPYNDEQRINRSLFLGNEMRVTRVPMLSHASWAFGVAHGLAV